MSLIVLKLLPSSLLRQWYTFLCLLGCHFPWQDFSYFKFVTKPCVNSIIPQEYFSLLLMCIPWVFRTVTRIFVIPISKIKCAYPHKCRLLTSKKQTEDFITKNNQSSGEITHSCWVYSIFCKLRKTWYTQLCLVCNLPWLVKVVRSRSGLFFMGSKN